MPHSGTKSRLLKTTTRSLTDPLIGLELGAPGEELVDLVAWPCMRSRLHFCSAPVQNKSVSYEQCIREQEKRVRHDIGGLSSDEPLKAACVTATSKRLVATVCGTERTVGHHETVPVLLNRWLAWQALGVCGF